jgi:choline kinase/mannose-6-phosphate isomerase-like protein (cupin superfamily)
MKNLNHPPAKTVIKPWGSEVWHCLCSSFCVKTIRLISGSRTSFQWHRQKEEINFIESGEAEVWLENDGGEIVKHRLKAGDSFFVPVTKKHRVIAITDLEMFEVSNQYVDDVVRINDEFGRGDGKIEAEHKTPAVLVLAAGLGSRLGRHTKDKNKALLPIANKAVISHVVQKFPKEHEIVVACGYQAESLKEYCRLAHPERSFQFVDVDSWQDPKTDPGHSALACKQYLQRPFYLAAVDSLIAGDVPHIDGNWVGVYPTGYPEKYATVDVKNGSVVAVKNKSEDGFDNAFMGLAAIFDYATFWAELEKSERHELVSAWKNPSVYPTLGAKELKWFDAGNLDDLGAAREHFGEKTLNSDKSVGETVYRVGDWFLKFHPEPIVTANRLARGQTLGELVPCGLNGEKHFISYDWQNGKNLYEYESLDLCLSFLRHLFDAMASSTTTASPELSKRFYTDKTMDRASLFASKYGDGYLQKSISVNGVARPAVRDLLLESELEKLNYNPLYSKFHGDLHFDNVIYNEALNRFVYVDWRESYAGSTVGGDVYYDLGKLYAGCLVPFELLKSDKNVSLAETESGISYAYDVPPYLQQFTAEYENWLGKNGFDLDKVKLVAGLAFLNIAPLHTDVWNKVLFAKSIELLHDHVVRM